MNLEAQKKRMVLMFAINGVCLLAAAISLYANIRYDIGWLMAAFVGALLIGFGAQIWFVAGFAKAGRAE
jgi:uncharacterized membrane protein